MPTTNYNLPTISPSDIADVPRDMNALANAVDTAIMNTTSNKAPINSPAFTGIPTAPTADVTNNSTQIATTSYVKSNVGPITQLSTDNKSNTVAAINELNSNKAPKNSPALTGIPTAPTAPYNTNNLQIANTFFVMDAITTFVGNKSVLTTTNKNYIVGAINELDLEKAPTNSPAFTGVPTAPTADVTTNSTQIATTSFVKSNVGPITQLSTDNKTNTVAAINELVTNKAPKNSPAFTGSPTAPTQVFGNNNTLIATTAFANEAVITRLGTVANLTTTDKSTPVAAINELNSTKAPKNSPVFTGTPTAPTAVTDNSSTQLATTAYVKANTGDRGQLLTTNKANMVGAINELFTSVSSGKNAIASAITSFGVEAHGSDTFAQLSQQINSIPRQASGFVNVSSDLLSFSRVYPTSAVANRRYITVSGLNFTPSVIIISGPTERYTVEFNGAHRLENRSILMYGSVDMREVVSNNVSSSYVNATGFRLPVPNDSVAGESVRWQAFA